MSQNLWNNKTVKRYRKNKIDEKIASNFEANRIEKYGILMRVSTDMQVKDGESLDMQRNLSMEFIKNNGGVLSKTYLEEGVSASKNTINQRPVMMELIDDIRSGKVNHVLAYKRDRISRIPEDSKLFYKILREHGCKITLTARNEIQIDLNESEIMSSMMESIQLEASKVESLRTSERVADTMLDIAEKGIWTGGQPPIGYELITGEDDFTYVKPLEWFIPTVREIEELYVGGYGIKAIAKWLNGGEVRGLETLSTPRRKPITNNKVSKEWNDQNIMTVLFNPVYTGYLYYQSRKYDIEPVITKSPYITPCRTEEIQIELNSIRQEKIANRNNPKRYNTPFLLSGILRCAECGAYYTTSTSQNKNGIRHSYYKCKNKHSSKKEHCNSVIFRKESLETFVMSYAEDLINQFVDSDVFTIVKKKLSMQDTVIDDQIEVIRSHINSHEKKLANTMDLLLELDRASPTYQMMKKNYEDTQIKLLTELNEYKESLKELEDKSSEVESDDYSFEEFMRLIERFRGIIDVAPISVKKRIIEKLFSEISADRNGEISMKLAFDIKVKSDTDTLETFIENDMNGEGIVAECINGGLVNMDYKFNYFTELATVKSVASENFFTFLCTVDEKFHNIECYNDDEIILNSSNIQGGYKRIINNYIEEKLEINAYARKRLQNGLTIQYPDMVKYMERLGVNVDDYILYLNSEFGINLTEGLIEESISTVNIYPENDLSNKLICGDCGGKFKRITKNKSKSYKCVKNRSDIQSRCHSKTVAELSIIKYFEKINVKLDEIKQISIVQGMVTSYE